MAHSPDPGWRPQGLLGVLLLLGLSAVPLLELPGVQLLPGLPGTQLFLGLPVRALLPVLALSGQVAR